MTIELNFDAKFDSTQLFSSNFDVGLLTKCEVKMAGYWSSVLCACRDGFIKGFIIWPPGNFS